jgi:hypothetical protein
MVFSIYIIGGEKMAYNEEAKRVSLKINYENGLNENGEMTTRYKTFRDINVKASPEIVGETAKMLAGFMKDKFVSASKIVEYDLVENEG